MMLGSFDILEFLKNDPLLYSNLHIQKGIHDMEILLDYLTDFQIIPYVGLHYKYSSSKSQGIFCRFSLIFHLLVDLTIILD
jgi:hypothetical protein